MLWNSVFCIILISIQFCYGQETPIGTQEPVTEQYPNNLRILNFPPPQVQPAPSDCLSRAAILSILELLSNGLPPERPNGVPPAENDKFLNILVLIKNILGNPAPNIQNGNTNSPSYIFNPPPTAPVPPENYFPSNPSAPPVPQQDFKSKITIQYEFPLRSNNCQQAESALNFLNMAYSQISKYCDNTGTCRYNVLYQQPNNLSIFPFPNTPFTLNPQQQFPQQNNQNGQYNGQNQQQLNGINNLLNNIRLLLRNSDHQNLSVDIIQQNETLFSKIEKLILEYLTKDSEIQNQNVLQNSDLSNEVKNLIDFVRILYNYHNKRFERLYKAVLAVYRIPHTIIDEKIISTFDKPNVIIKENTNYLKERNNSPGTIPDAASLQTTLDILKKMSDFREKSNLQSDELPQNTSSVLVNPQPYTNKLTKYTQLYQMLLNLLKVPEVPTNQNTNGDSNLGGANGQNLVTPPNIQNTNTQINHGTLSVPNRPPAFLDEQKTSQFNLGPLNLQNLNVPQVLPSTNQLSVPLNQSSNSNFNLPDQRLSATNQSPYTQLNTRFHLPYSGVMPNNLYVYSRPYLPYVPLGPQNLYQNTPFNQRQVYWPYQTRYNGLNYLKQINPLYDYLSTLSQRQYPSGANVNNQNNSSHSNIIQYQKAPNEDSMNKNGGIDLSAANENRAYAKSFITGVRTSTADNLDDKLIKQYLADLKQKLHVSDSELDLAENIGGKIVELTYVLNQPQVIQNRPIFLKYRIPYDRLVADISYISQGLPENFTTHNKDILDLINKNATIVSAKILEPNSTVIAEQLKIIKDLNSALDTQNKGTDIVVADPLQILEQFNKTISRNDNNNSRTPSNENNKTSPELKISPLNKEPPLPLLIQPPLFNPLAPNNFINRG